MGTPEEGGARNRVLALHFTELTYFNSPGGRSHAKCFDVYNRDGRGFRLLLSSGWFIVGQMWLKGLQSPVGLQFFLFFGPILCTSVFQRTGLFDRLRTSYQP